MQKLMEQQHKDKKITWSSWASLSSKSPIDLNRVKLYSERFNSVASVPISLKTLGIAKRRLSESRNHLDMMIITLIQSFSPFLKEKADLVIFTAMKEDLGRVLGSLDKEEREFIVNPDGANPKTSVVGVSRISSYIKSMKNVHDTIFEVLVNSLKEYFEFEETAEMKREPRTFFYIVFNKLGVSLAFLGGITRFQEKNDKRNSYQGNYSNMLSSHGQNYIKDHSKDIAGVDLSNIPDDMLEVTEEVIGEQNESNN